MAMKTLFFLASTLMSFTILTGCSSAAYKPGLRNPTAPASGIDHSEYRVRSKDNLSLFAQAWRPQGDVKGALILVHGLKDHSDRYNDFATTLAKNGVAVFAFDLRGHGDSEGDREWVKPFDQYLDDLDLFYQKVRQELPARPIFLFGHSMGGAIVTLYTLERKPEIKGLILSAPALKPGADVNAFLIGVTGVIGTIAPALPVLKLDPHFFTRDPLAKKNMETDPLITPGKVPARTAKELLGALEKIQAEQENLQVAFITIHGSDDKVTNPDGSRLLNERASSKDKTLKIYDGAFHDLLHDLEKEKVTVDLTEWLQKRL